MAAMADLAPVATPTEDLDARRSWTGPTLAAGVLTEAIVAFCQSGLGIAVASRDVDGWPVVARGRGCRIDAEGRVRVILRAAAAAALLDAVATGRPVAVTFSQPGSHRSIQLKASRATVSPVEPADGPAAEAQAAVFRALLVAAAYPVRFVDVYCGDGGQGIAVISLMPEAAFVQTPGPGAGSALVG